MAGEANIVQETTGDIKDVGTSANKENVGSAKKKQGGVISRIWNGIFGLHGDDFEKRLQYISKAEAAILARMKNRSKKWRSMARHLIIFSVIFEVIAVVYAIMTTRSLELNWKVRALRVLPMFLLPVLSSFTYSGLSSFTKMCDSKDQKTLERLRDERQEKINELKEKTNYYTTQQLIQRYDTDPAAKAAAASVLASKLGADSGLRVYLEDDSQLKAPTGKSHDVELVQSSGLRHRRPLTRSISMGSAVPKHYDDDDDDDEMVGNAEDESSETSVHNQLLVEHRLPGYTTRDGGWLARVAALLVGEDPTQCYALICGNCHMHNGLARKEDFPYVTYYCPHCKALNRSKYLDGVAGSDLTGMNSLAPATDTNKPTGVVTPASSTASTGGTGAAAADTASGSEQIVSEDPEISSVEH